MKKPEKPLDEIAIRMLPTTTLVKAFIQLLDKYNEVPGIERKLLKLETIKPDLKDVNKTYKDTADVIKAFLERYEIASFTFEDVKELKTQLLQTQEEEKIKKAEENQIHYLVMNHLALKKKTIATEIIVDFIEKREHIHTTRNDEKSEMWIYKEGIYVPQGKTYIQEHCRKILAETYTTNLVNQVISKIETDTFIEQEELFKDNPPYYQPVENGLLNLKTKELEPFTHEIKFFNKMPVIFNPTYECPSIKEFFKSLFKDEKELDVIQELFGFLLYDEYFIEKATMFNGDGRNGKSKTFEIMKHFIGAENCVEISLEQMEDGDSFIIYQLHKKKANLCGDLSKTALKNTGNFKKLTGRDLITANRKFLNPITFINKAKMLFSCNELPIIYENTDAFWNRWAVVNFPYTFLPEKEYEKRKHEEHIKLADPSIIEKITSKEELSGLLNWALKGLERLLEKKDFSKSPSGEEIRIWWTRRSDSLKAFCMDCIQGDAWDEHISKAEFRQKYTEYCRKHKTKMVGDKHIKTILSIDYGVSEIRINDSNRTHVWLGITWKNGQDGQGISEVEEKKTEEIDMKLASFKKDGQDVQETNVIYPYREKKKNKYKVKNPVQLGHPVHVSKSDGEIVQNITLTLNEKNKVNLTNISKFLETDYDRVVNLTNEYIIKNGLGMFNPRNNDEVLAVV